MCFHYNWTTRSWSHRYCQLPCQREYPIVCAFCEVKWRCTVTLNSDMTSAGFPVCCLTVVHTQSLGTSRGTFSRDPALQSLKFIESFVKCLSLSQFAHQRFFCRFPSHTGTSLRIVRGMCKLSTQPLTTCVSLIPHLTTVG